MNLIILRNGVYLAAFIVCVPIILSLAFMIMVIRDFWRYFIYKDIS